MTFRCEECGYRSGKWMGFCPQCRSDAGLVEDDRAKLRRAAPIPVPLPVAGSRPVARASVGMAEIDRVLGGGLVPGSVVLVGGEPGVGKSTLLLQVAGSLAVGGRKVLMATAEESEDQVGLRAQRLDISTDDVLLLPEEDVDSVLAAADEMRPDLLIVDSIQTVGAVEVGSGPGSIAQVRECGARLTRFAKESGVAVVLVGHVTKDGGIAGPKLLEHMVDVVLYLEGESEQGLRTSAPTPWRRRAVNDATPWPGPLWFLQCRAADRCWLRFRHSWPQRSWFNRAAAPAVWSPPASISCWRFSPDTEVCLSTIGRYMLVWSEVSG